jgi:hypothetical protein
LTVVDTAIFKNAQHYTALFRTYLRITLFTEKVTQVFHFIESKSPTLTAFEAYQEPILDKVKCWAKKTNFL